VSNIGAAGLASSIKRDYSKAKLTTPRSEKGAMGFEDQGEGLETSLVLDETQ
jgi:hypothetical protein